MTKKEIKGVPIYVFRGKKYKKKPKFTRVYDVIHDEYNYSTFVYLKANTYFIEFLSVCIVLFAIVCFMLSSKLHTTVHIPDTFEYYNNTLYCNILVDNSSNLQQTITVGSYSKDVKPGECIAVVEGVDYTPTITVTVQTGSGIFTKSKTVDVNVRKIGEQQE